MKRKKLPGTAILDLSGMEFGKLTVQGFHEAVNGNAKWRCLCECGEETNVLASVLKRGGTKSCGCNLKGINKTHGLSKSSTYNSFKNARARCNYENDVGYHNYGGRGIKFLFNTFEDFLLEVGEKPNKLCTIDRIDVDGNYEVGNIRWASREEQSNNRRNNKYLEYKGETKSLSIWCKELGMKYNLVRDRLKMGWSIERAFTEEKN